MIYILTTSILNVWMLSLLWRKSRPTHKVEVRTIFRDDKSIKGKLDNMYVSAKIAEKMADRAFNMASSANIGVVALQKALATPRLMSKPQVVQNLLAKKGVDEVLGEGSGFDWLRPILSDEDLEILDQALDLKAKKEMDNHQ